MQTAINNVVKYLQDCLATRSFLVDIDVEKSDLNVMVYNVRDFLLDQVIHNNRKYNERDIYNVYNALLCLSEYKFDQYEYDDPEHIEQMYNKNSVLFEKGFFPTLDHKQNIAEMIDVCYAIVGEINIPSECMKHVNVPPLNKVAYIDTKVDAGVINTFDELDACRHYLQACLDEEKWHIENTGVRPVNNWFCILHGHMMQYLYEQSKKLNYFNPDVIYNVWYVLRVLAINDFDASKITTFPLLPNEMYISPEDISKNQEEYKDILKSIAGSINSYPPKNIIHITPENCPYKLAKQHVYMSMTIEINDDKISYKQKVVKKNRRSNDIDRMIGLEADVNAPAKYYIDKFDKLIDYIEDNKVVE